MNAILQAPRCQNHKAGSVRYTINWMAWAIIGFCAFFWISLALLAFKLWG